MTYLTFIQKILPLQSAKFLRVHFWESLHKMKTDPVPGVRITLAQTLNSISEFLYFECSSEIAALIEELLEDSVLEVSALARKASERFHSAEFVAHMHSKAVQLVQEDKARFEAQQEKDEATEAEEDKQRMVNELTAKAYSDLKVKLNKNYQKGRVPMNVARGSLKDSKSVSLFKRKK